MQPPLQPRLRQPDRSVQLPHWSLDQSLPFDHCARDIWSYVSTVDLSGFLARIRACEGRPGRDATDPRLLLGLWMYATAEGVGSARWLDELCIDHIGFRWLCGGVTVNYHLLSDFRSDFEAELDTLLVDHVAALMHQDVVHLKRVAQDGMRTRAHAGAGSFRRAETLEQCQQQVAEQLALLKQQADEPPGSAARRSRAARERHLEEKQERLQAARAAAAELEAKRTERLRQRPSEAAGESPEEAGKKAGRGSMTDPEARRMKMADGGFRPAYNVQFATTTAEGIIVEVAVTNAGTDSGLMGSMLEQIETDYGELPEAMEVDGGYVSNEDVEAAAAQNVTVYTPLKNAEKDKKAGKNPYEAKPQDKAGMAALRVRMGTEEGKKIYRERAATAEWVNAGMRNRGLYQFLVRGLRKVRAVALLQALTHNLFTTIRICREKKLAGDWIGILRTGLAAKELAAE
jgi:transposase